MELSILFSFRDLLVFGTLFVASIVYAFLLQLWWRRYPQSYETLTWFQVVIGVGYVLIGLGFILPLEYWLKVDAAFFFACLAIIARSVFVHSINQRDAEGIPGRATDAQVGRSSTRPEAEAKVADGGQPPQEGGNGRSHTHNGADRR